METKDIEELELSSEAISDYLAQIPNWILRWGTIVITAVIIFALSISWFVRYPTIVRATFRLTSTNAPKPVIPKIDGRLERLFVTENQVVSFGEILGFVESTAKHEEVLDLEKQLANIQNLVNQHNFEGLEHISLPNFEHLGDVQSTYQTFQQSYVQVISMFADGYYLRKKAFLEKDIQQLEEMNLRLKEQQQMYGRDAELSEKEYRMNQKLYIEKVIASVDLDREESKMLSKKLPIKNIESSIINNNTLRNAKQKEILELDKSVKEQKEGFKQLLNTLRSVIESWKSRYLLVSPSNGQVYFSTLIQEKQALKTGVELLSVGTKNNQYFGDVRIPQDNFGKVKIGQEVLIKFQSYPFEEYGAVRGKITSISEIPSQEHQYVALVQFIDGLKTTNKKQITYKSGMDASAEIITEDLRLIERLFYQFRKIFGQL